VLEDHWEEVPVTLAEQAAEARKAARTLAILVLQVGIDGLGWLRGRLMDLQRGLW
jgi:hypothetical protein